MSPELGQYAEAESNIPKGTLIFIGGGASRELLQTTDGFFVHNSPVGIMPLATDERLTYFRDCKPSFHESFGLFEPWQLDDFLTEGMKAIYIPGGDQEKLVNILGMQRLQRLKKLYDSGGTIVGTSAGLCMGEFMIVGTNGGGYRLAEGMGLTSKVITDSHFSQRNRLDRLTRTIRAVAEANRHAIPPIGIGVDEDTAAILRQNRFVEVFGTGSVTVVDYISNRDTKLTINILKKGDKYDLNKRSRI